MDKVRAWGGVAIALAMWGGVQSAMSASFDCAKAQSSLEKAICVDPELSVADEKLAAAYAAAREGLGEGGRQALLWGQRDWLDYAERACTADAAPQTGAYNDDGRSCLLGVFNQRVSVLAQGREIDGMRFYVRSAYNVLRDPEATAESWNKVALKSLNSLRMDGDSSLAVAFNRFADQIDALTLEAIESAKDPYTDLDVIVEISHLDAARISLEETGYTYGHGAAHPNSFVAHHHFLRAGMRPLAATDLFSDPEWVKVVTPKIIALLKASLGADTIWEDLEGIEKTVADPTAWILNEHGFGVQFQPYEVAAYAFGAPAVFVPWVGIVDQLSPDAWEIISPR